MSRALLLVLCTAALPALAFEGVIDTKMTISAKEMGMSGTGTITIKGLNFRMDNEMALPTGPTKMTSIARAEEPGVTYILNDRNKTFQKIDSKKDAPDGDAEKWTVKKLGKETIAGRTTEHVTVQRDNKSETMEVWVDTHLVSAADLAKAFSQGSNNGWWKALEKAGVAGVPLKFVSHSKEGKDQATWEATRVTAKPVPSSAFQIPPGYTEGSSFGMGAVGGGAMDKLTPEQKKQLEEMMKKAGDGAK
jgi:hypothetical protein